ncbi:putative transmembrane protein 217B isoform X1 [Manis javanica]|uniref:putative transmembrane protein 217B isoform X1 n=1 Tax=Manis javanica TaxID=9974 RepID=UPI003C6CD28F|nr:Transmembrane protein 217 [Manis javanica]
MVTSGVGHTGGPGRRSRGPTGRRSRKFLIPGVEKAGALMKQNKMNNKMFSSVVGIFSIFNTIQFLLIDLNQVIYIDYEENFSIYMDTNSEIVFWVMTRKKIINICLSIVTITVSILLLYCTRMNYYMGLLCYAMWIITYELISFSMVLLINGVIREQFKELRYMNLIFQISRMLLQFFCLPFLIKHTYTLYKGPKILSKQGHRRRSSVNTGDSWSPVGPRALHYPS